MNQVTSALHIPDTQSERDERHLMIQRVGVKDVRYPLQVQVGKQAQHTVGTWTLDVALPAEKKGTHMSRFVAWLDALSTPLDAKSLRELHGAMLTKLEAVEGRGRDLLDVDPDRTSGGDRHSDQGLLAPGTSAGQPWLVAADEGLIHLDDASQPFAARTHQHRPQPVEHRPRRRV